jgi:hypothetical protein
MAIASKFTFDSNKADRMIKDSTVKFIDKKAKELKRAAKLKVRVRTGALKRSINILSRKYVGGAYQVVVGSNLNYAYPHHEGTRAYIITPRPGNKVMRFKGGKGIATDANGYVYARRVRHPKVKANRYLSGPAKILFRK